MNRDAENLADYDTANRLLSERQNIGAGAKMFTYSHTNDSLSDTVTYPSGAQVQQTYTNRRQLYAVNLAAPGEQQLTPQAWHEYDAAGRLTMRHRANNTETLWEYDANSRVTHLAHQAAQGGQIFQSWTYAYSDEGNPLAQKDTTPNLTAWGEAYRYDMMNRLIDAKRGPVDANNNVPVLDILLRQQWDLTKVGDWEQWTKSQQGQQDVIETRDHNDLHSLTSRTIDQDSAKNLVYDPNGNQIDDGETFLFEYDANDQLKTVRNRATNAIVAEYRYDVFGRRVEKDVKTGNPKGAPVGITRYYYTGQQIAEERDGNDVTQAFYTYGHYIDEPLTMDRWNGETFTRYFYHQNRMFSTYVLTDWQGSIAERYSYTAYGECKTYLADYTAEQSVSRVGSPFTFTGRELDDETGWMCYRTRIYNPATGRMDQADPLGLAAGMNLYEYAVSSPADWLDPNGLASFRYTARSNDAGINYKELSSDWRIASKDKISGYLARSYKYTWKITRSRQVVIEKAPPPVTCYDVDEVQVEIVYTLSITLPAWTAYKSAAKQYQARWDAFINKLRSHERGHQFVTEVWVRYFVDGFVTDHPISVCWCGNRPDKKAVEESLKRQIDGAFKADMADFEEVLANQQDAYHKDNPHEIPL